MAGEPTHHDSEHEIELKRICDLIQQTAPEHLKTEISTLIDTRALTNVLAVRLHRILAMRLAQLIQSSNKSAQLILAALTRLPAIGPGNLVPLAEPTASLEQVERVNSQLLKQADDITSDESEERRSLTVKLKTKENVSLRPKRAREASEEEVDAKRRLETKDHEFNSAEKYFQEKKYLDAKIGFEKLLVPLLLLVQERQDMSIETRNYYAKILLYCVRCHLKEITGDPDKKKSELKILKLASKRLSLFQEISVDADVSKENFEYFSDRIVERYLKIFYNYAIFCFNSSVDILRERGIPDKKQLLSALKKCYYYVAKSLIAFERLDYHTAESKKFVQSLEKLADQLGVLIDNSKIAWGQLDKILLLKYSLEWYQKTIECRAVVAGLHKKANLEDSITFVYEQLLGCYDHSDDPDVWQDNRITCAKMIIRQLLKKKLTGDITIKNLADHGQLFCAYASLANSSRLDSDKARYSYFANEKAGEISSFNNNNKNHVQSEYPQLYEMVTDFLSAGPHSESSTSIAAQITRRRRFEGLNAVEGTESLIALRYAVP